MMISILHKLLSTGTVAAKVGMEEVLSEVPGGSKACMVNHIKGTGRTLRRRTTSIQHLQRIRAHSHSNTRHLAETALLLEVSATLGGLGRRNRRITLSNIPGLVLVIMVACLMCLGVLSRPIRGRIRVLALTWSNRAATMIHFAIMVIRPKCLVAPVLRWASLEDVLDLLRMRQVKQDCHNLKRKVKARANKATVDTWAIRCMVSMAHNTVEAQEAWAADTTNLEDKIIRPVATELTGRGMGQGSTGTAIAVGGVPTTGTEF